MNELVTLRNDQIVTTSREIAKTFNKRHDHVLRDIDALKKDVPNFGEMFFESTEEDSYGRPQRIYYLKRDGFSLLAMGFTGSEAMEWKIKYIKAFNAMEEAWNTPEMVFARAVKFADRQIAELNNKVLQLETDVERMKPKVDYCSKILESTNTMLVTQIAQDYGMSAVTFNKLLHELGIQRKVNGQWILYEPYLSKKYTKSHTHSYERIDGSKGSRPNTEWTQEGRMFLYNFLKDKGILPKIEGED